MHLVALIAAKKYKDRGCVKFLEILLCSKETLSLCFRNRSDYIKFPIQEAKNDACFFLLCQVCKYYLCGFCPAELFTNTRSDLGKFISHEIFIHLKVITAKLLFANYVFIVNCSVKHLEFFLFFQFKGCQWYTMLRVIFIPDPTLSKWKNLLKFFFLLCKLNYLWGAFLLLKCQFLL